MGNLQNYGGFDLDVFDEDDKEIEKSSKSSEFMTMEKGDNVVRFLPPPADAAWAKRPDGKISPFKVIHEHFVEVPGLKRKVRFVCPRLHGGGHCPACSDADALIRTGNPFDKDKARDMYPSARTYANVIDRNDEARGPKVLGFSKTIREGLKRARNRFGDFTDPSEGGFDIIIEKVDKNGKIEYNVEADRGNSPLGNEEWLESQFNLDSYARVPTLEEIKDMLSGKESRGGRGGRNLGGGESRGQLSDGRGGRDSGGRGSRSSGGRSERAAAKTERAEPQREERSSRRTAADDVYDAEFEEAEDLDAALEQDEDGEIPF